MLMQLNPAALLLDRFGRAAENRAVTFLSQRCLRSRLNTNTCTLCLSECPGQALLLEGGAIVFDEEKCSHCLRCIALCPNDAFSSELNPLSLLPLLSEKESVLFSCDQALSHPDKVSVPCLGFLSEPLLAVMAVCCNGVIALDSRCCPTCKNVHILNGLRKAIGSMREKNEALGNKFQHITDRSLLPRADQKSERRSLLRTIITSLAGDNREQPVCGDEEHGSARDSASKEPSRTSKALSHALQELGPNQEAAKTLLLSYHSTVEVSAACDLCPACTGMCPTGALKREKDGERKYLRFVSSACSGCGLCRNFCKKKAILVREGFKGDPSRSYVLSRSGK